MLYYWLPDYDIRSLTFNGKLHFLEGRQITKDEMAGLLKTKNVYTAHNTGNDFNTSVIFSNKDDYLAEKFFLGKISGLKLLPK